MSNSRTIYKRVCTESCVFEFIYEISIPSYLIFFVKIFDWRAIDSRTIGKLLRTKIIKARVRHNIGIIIQHNIIIYVD